MRALEMINRSNASSNVAKIMIKLTSDYEWNDQIIRLIMDRYSNVHDIYLHDFNG